jgi:hypothetical protein
MEENFARLLNIEPQKKEMKFGLEIEIGSGNPLLMSKTCPGSAST